MLSRVIAFVMIACLVSGSSQAQTASESMEVGLISVREVGDIVIGIDAASIVDGSAIVFDMSVMNRSDENILFLVSERQSAVLVAGERGLRPFEVFGIARCAHESDHCVTHYGDDAWSVLVPGVLHEFRIATIDGNGTATAAQASVNLRAFAQTADGRTIHDIAFARIPIAP